MVVEGDIVVIPLPDGRVAIGWILHVSQRFKNCVGFVVMGIKGQLREDVDLDPNSGQSEAMLVLGPLYTSIIAINDYGWSVAGHQPLSESKRLLTKRRVGGNVYVGDECVGPVSQDKVLPAMLVMGMPVVYREIDKAFEGGLGKK